MNHRIETSSAARRSGSSLVPDAGRATRVSPPPLITGPGAVHTVRDAHDLEELLPHLADSAGATFLAADFGLLEALVAHGVDSSQVLVMPDEPDPAWLQRTVERATGEPVVPPTPHAPGARALVVVPTYNERDNLEALVASVATHIVADVLVVDDDSPDGTGQLADRLTAERPNLHVLHREKKEGIGRAYRDGFRWGLERGGYDLIFEMDADFSHAPWDLPRLAAAATDADLVIGSRYVAGGDTTGWDEWRRRLSRAGNRYARLWLGGRLADMTAGFRCYRSDVLRRIDLDAVTTDGYAFQIEMAWRVRRAGGGVREIPVHFVDRRAGQSKMSRAIAWEAVWKLPVLRLRAALGRSAKR